LVAFDREKPGLGGALLACAIVAKMFPAVLLLGLVARRRWRDVRWTIACGCCLTIVALTILGRDPFIAFLTYQLPRLADGAAFSFIARPGTPLFFMSRNFSIASIVPKLRLLGATGLPPQVAAAPSLAYTVVVFWLAWRASAGDGARLQRAQRWLALLNLAALCSPLAPSAYVVAPTLWLLALLAGEVRGRTLPALGLGAAWLVVMGPPPLPDSVDLAIGLIAQVFIVAVNVWALLRGAPAVEVDGKDNIDAFDASTGVASPRWRVHGALFRQRANCAGAVDRADMSSARHAEQFADFGRAVGMARDLIRRGLPLSRHIARRPNSLSLDHGGHVD